MNDLVQTENTLTAESAYQQWIRQCRLRLKANTSLQYERLYCNHLRRPLGSVPLASLTADDITRMTEALLREPLSPKTVNDILMVLNLILHYAKEEYGIQPPRIRRVKQEQKQMRVLSVEEQHRLTAYLMHDTDIFKLGVLLALYSGLRIGELCALRWEDINSDCIVISKTMMRIKDEAGGTKIAVDSPKSKTGRRMIPTPSPLVPLLHRFRRKGYFLSDDRLAFAEPRLMQKKFARYVSDCRLEGVTFHTLRHTFATRCVEAGVDIKTLSELLGHRDIRTTLNRYVHSSFEQKQRSMRRFEAYIQ